jgi:hypothetical protein
MAFMVETSCLVMGQAQTVFLPSVAPMVGAFPVPASGLKKSHLKTIGCAEAAALIIVQPA